MERRGRTATVAVSEQSMRTKTREGGIRIPSSPFNLHSCAIERESSLSQREIDALQKWRRRHSDVSSDHLVGRHSRSISSTYRPTDRPTQLSHQREWKSGCNRIYNNYYRKLRCVFLWAFLVNIVFSLHRLSMNVQFCVVHMAVGISNSSHVYLGKSWHLNFVQRTEIAATKWRYITALLRHFHHA